MGRFAAFLAVALAACSGSPNLGLLSPVDAASIDAGNAVQCVNGSVVACTCAGLGMVGAQTCLSEALGPCVCPDAGSAATPDAAVDEGSLIDAQSDSAAEDASDADLDATSAIDAGMDVSLTDAGVDVPPFDTGVDVPMVDTGVDVPPIDTGVDVPPVDTGVDVPTDVCAAPRSACPSGCTTTATDPDNCGGCGNACAAGMTCITGVCTEPTGEQSYTTAGDYNFVVPAGVTSVSAVVVGPGRAGPTTSNNLGGAGGGALCYLNNVTVTPGESIAVVLGGTSTSFHGTLVANAGSAPSSATGGAGGTGTGGTCFAGGHGGSFTGHGEPFNGGGGGAAGYSGNGGNGSDASGSSCPGNATAGSGGGGGGGGAGSNSGNCGDGYGAGGGGVGLNGIGASGAAGAAYCDCPRDGTHLTGYPGGGGSGGSAGAGTGGVDGTAGSGGSYGGGSGTSGTAASGAARIIWGPGRSFPNNAM